MILPLYNDASSIGEVLDALDHQRTGRGFEVLVVDDGSSDDGPAVAARHGATVIAQQNAGPAAARNRGAAEARGMVLLFLDSDCVPPPDWVETMARALDDPAFDAVMGTIRAANDGVIPRIVQMEVAERYDGMAAAGAHGVDFIAAPACGFRRDVFLAIGGFDMRLRQAEDVEIAYRLTGAGHSIAFVDTVPVAHHHQTGWREFLAVKHRRARGRMEVFSLFPEKRRHDAWTPIALKLQFGFAALAAAGVLSLPLTQGTGLRIAAAALICLCLAGWPTIRRIATALAPLTGRPGGLLRGAGFVIARAFVILAAVAEVKLARPRLRPAPT